MVVGILNNNSKENTLTIIIAQAYACTQWRRMYRLLILQ